MFEQSKIKIRIEGVSRPDASGQLADLREYILDSHREVSAEVVQDQPTNMDFGATLIVLMGTSAVIAVAKGIGEWIKRMGSKGDLWMEIDGNVIRFAGGSADAAKIAQAFAAGKK